MFPRVAIHDERTEIRVILKVDFADDVRNLMPDWSFEGAFGDDQEVDVRFVIGFTAGD